MRFFLVCCLIATAAIAGCANPHKSNLPPAQMLMEPGPGVGGPGPGVSVYAPMPPLPPLSSQILFVGPEGMIVSWDVAMPGAFDSMPLTCPGRHNFPQGAIYRLKLTNIPGRPGVELYPTLEVGPVLPRTQAFLAHNAIPVQFVEEDFDQVLTGNFVTKVIYLPDPEFQELALAGVETLVSTRLDPGIDPIVEADRRGAILAIVRLGNKDLEIPAEMIQEGGVMQASYGQFQGGMGPHPMAAYDGMPGMTPMGVPVGGETTLPTNYIAGVTAPQWGMPMSGTPIGLPGPPHVPLGAPAGLQRHSIVNRTKVHVPEPTAAMRVDVKQKPGLSYPKPASNAKIVEKSHTGWTKFWQPFGNRREVIRPPKCDACGGNGCASCPQ
jgi:hypothetical protein